jgi:ribonucleotide reductase alpha subunit
MHTSSVGTTTMSPFALDVMNHKYAHTKQDGNKEMERHRTRQAIVLKAVGAKKSLVDEIVHRIEQRKFLPGGRYLYATGRPFHQTQNCLLMRAETRAKGGRN